MLWYVAIGSAAGGVSRYLLGGFIQRILSTSFPTGTLVINLTGSAWGSSSAMPSTCRP